jgi:alpha-tubulin suppressor-like RCC1 family protein
VGRRHTIGLKSDGTVLGVGDNKYGQCNVSVWRDIVAVSADNIHMATNTCNAHTIGLKSDDTVAAVGNNRYGQCSRPRNEIQGIDSINRNLLCPIIYIM